MVLVPDEIENIERIDNVLNDPQTDVKLSVELVADQIAFLRADGGNATIGELRNALLRKLREHRNDELRGIRTLSVES
jgi:hypothetical protein